MSASEDPFSDSPSSTLEHQLAAAFVALVFALCSMWLARYLIAIAWPEPAAVDLSQWIWTTLKRYGADAERHREWLRLWRIDYHAYLLAVAAAGLPVWATLFAVGTRRSVLATNAAAGGGFAVGAALGWALPFAAPMGAMGAVLALPGLAFLTAMMAAITIDARRVDIVPKRGTMVRQAGHASDRSGVLSLAGVKLPQDAETRHAVLLGATGTGKSTAMRELMHGAVARGDTAVIADPDGTAMTRLRQADDFVFNPLTESSVRWDLAAELSHEMDYRLMAEALAPHSGSAEDRRWTEAARLVLAAVLAAWRRSGGTGIAELTALLAETDASDLAALCEGTPAARFFAEGNERFLGSVLSALSTPTDILIQAAAGQGANFSIRQFVLEEALRKIQGRSGRRLWMPYGANELPLFRHVFSTWLSLAMTETLALPECRSRRLWFFVDEADQLGRIEALELIMTKGRKKGACVVLGFQSIAQLQQQYGMLIADVVNEQCGTRLILRCDTSREGGTAKFASDLIGEREVATPEETTSYSRGNNPSTSISRALRRHVEKAVLPSEIAQLPDCEGYLRVAREPHWQRVRFGPAG